MLKIIKNIKITYDKINYIFFNTIASNKCCRRTKAGRDNSGFLTKSGAVSDYERVK